MEQVPIGTEPRLSEYLFRQFNKLTIALNNLVANPLTGTISEWVASSFIASYVSADSPTFVISVAGDMTGLVMPGYRVKLSQTTDKFFIITAVGSFSGSATQITLFGGINYTLANAAIASFSYSGLKCPFGFIAEPALWTVKLSSTGDGLVVASSVLGTWYPLVANLDIPIGVWDITYEVTVQARKSLDWTAIMCNLSTTSAGNSDVDSMVISGGFFDTVAGTAYTTLSKRLQRKYTSKTRLYINLGANLVSGVTLILRGSFTPTRITAISGYL